MRLIPIPLARVGGKEEHTESVHVPLMIRTMVSPDPKTHVSADNSASCVPADGSGNMSSA